VLFADTSRKAWPHLSISEYRRASSRYNEPPASRLPIRADHFGTLNPRPPIDGGGDFSPEECVKVSERRAGRCACIPCVSLYRPAWRAGFGDRDEGFHALRDRVGKEHTSPFDVAAGDGLLDKRSLAAQKSFLIRV